MYYGGWFPAFDEKDERIADAFLNRDWFSRATVFLCKLLPAFIVNRISSTTKGFPYDESLNESAFSYILLKNKIDVVLVEFMLKGIIIKDVCEKLKIPFVVHTHGGGDIMAEDYIRNYSHSYLDMFRKAAKVISVDSYSSKKLIEFGLAEDKLTEIQLGIDLAIFKQTIPSLNKPVFFGVGRFVNKKAPYLTLMAFASVVQKHPEAKLILAGNGPLYDSCIQISKALHIENNVEFPLVISPEQVSEFMRQSRAFVQHSIHTTDGDSEGIPVAVLEAMACGLPVISTIHNGIADTITHGTQGLLVKENDIDGMAECMSQLIDDPLYADVLGANARKKVEENFEMSEVIGSLYQILEEASNSNRLKPS